MDDESIDGAMAHELAHLQIRRPLSCTSSECLRSLTLLNPVAALMSRQLELEEEKACDDVAVAIIGDPEAYAAMLLDGFRFARDRVGAGWSGLRVAAQLTGSRSALSERVERLLEAPENRRSLSAQLPYFAMLWMVLAVAVFSG